MRTIYAGVLYAGVLYTQAYYIRIYTFYYIIHTPRKNLFKINALPKILEKTCLKSMLCLFLDAMPKMPFLILGIGKSFKINNLRLIWGCCAHDSQNFGEGGGDQVLKFFRLQANSDERTKSRVLTKSKCQNRKRQQGIVGTAIIIYILLIFIDTTTHMPIFTPAYFRLHSPCISLRRNSYSFFRCNEMLGLCTFSKMGTATFSNNAKSL